MLVWREVQARRNRCVGNPWHHGTGPREGTKRRSRWRPLSNPVSGHIEQPEPLAEIVGLAGQPRVGKGGYAMETIVGSGNYTYKVREDWAQPPACVEMCPAAVTVGPHDHVYCFNRVVDHPVVVFDSDGNFLSSWGAGLFKFPHAIRFDSQGFAWLTDEHHQQFMKFTPDGQLLQTIGVKGMRSDTGVPADDFSSAAWKQVTHGGGPFNLPTDIAFAPDGSS